MRIIVGGMNHESNTLNPIITKEEDFVVFYGKEMLEKGMLPFYSSTGIIETLKEANCEIIPTVLARAVPNGVVSFGFYHKIKSEFIKRTKNALNSEKIDGVCLALHGSMKVENLGCAEGDLVSALREILPDIPFTVSLDMHATITPALLLCVNGFVGYKTAPHIDTKETGIHAARILLESIQTGKKLHSAYERIPMLIAGEKSETESEPMLSLIEMCRNVERIESVKSASFLLGFPWADDEHNSVSVLVTTLEDINLGKKVAKELKDRFWERRGDFAFRFEYYDSITAMNTAYKAVLEKKESPVFVSDSGDNPTAGATGDATELFEKILGSLEIVEKLPTQLLYSGFYDAPAVSACINAGIGNFADITLGGNFDSINGKKIPLRVRVENIVYAYGSFKSDLALVSFSNLLITITSKHIGFGDGFLLPSLNIDARNYCIVVVKLGYLEPCFSSIAKRTILALSKGCSNEVLESIPYKKIKRPIYPLDDCEG